MVFGQAQGTNNWPTAALYLPTLYHLYWNMIYSYSNTNFFSRSNFFTCGMCQAVSTLEQQPMFIQRTCKLQAASGKVTLASIHSMQYNHISQVKRKQIFRFIQTCASRRADDNRATNDCHSSQSNFPKNDLQHPGTFPTKSKELEQSCR